ncbi:MAG: LIM domain-containing protein [Promethearchaeota archaeon]
MTDKENIVTCMYCGREIKEEEAIYVEGEPYCPDCYSEAEIHADIPDD